MQPLPAFWGCIGFIAVVSTFNLLMAAKGRFHRRAPRLIRAQVMLGALSGFALAFALTCEAVSALPGLTRDQTFAISFISGGGAVVLAFAAAYLSLIRIPGMAVVGMSIPHWLQRMAMREDDGDDIRDSAENRND